MAFKMVTDSEKTAGRIAGVAKAHAEEMTAEQVQRWRGWLPDDAEDVGIGQIQRFYAFKLRRLCRALARVEKAHIRQLTAIKLLRQQRDEAAAQVRLKAYRVEKVLQGRHGETFAEVVLEGAAELADPMTLRRVATRVAKNLVDPGLRVPEPLVSGTELDFSDFAWEIAEPAGRLSAHLDDLEDQLPLLSRTLERKIQTLDAVKGLTKRLARFLEGLYGLEGHDELQAKVKQALKRAGQAVDAVERREAAAAEGGKTAEVRDPGAEAAEVADAVAAVIVEVAEDGAPDGRLRTAAQRLTLREDPMSDFDEGEREVLAEAAAYRAQRRAATQEAEAATREAPAQEAATREVPPPGADAAPGPPPRGARGTSEAAAVERMETSQEDPGSGSDSTAGDQAADASSAAERSTDGSGAAGRPREAASAHGGDGAPPGTPRARTAGGPRRPPDV